MSDLEDIGFDHDQVQEEGEPSSSSWLDEPSEPDDEVRVDEYDIVSSPNDWNCLTITSFIDSGAVKIPNFQRNYVWDQKRASKLIESLLLGLPIPQVFLYEEARNSFLVIDGQQRLLTLYFYMKGRFPKTSSRAAVRHLLQGGQGIDQAKLADDDLFEDFKLKLPSRTDGSRNKFHGKKYLGLEDYKSTLDLRTIRNIVVKQTTPEGDAAMFEIFNRLNSQGVNLTPQEIRASLFHSKLMQSVIGMNEDHGWRTVLGLKTPDPRMKDTEVLLRSLALARDLNSYSGTMANFINRFAGSAKRYSDAQADDAIADLRSFIGAVAAVGHPEAPEAFRRGGKFSGILFESVFAAWVQLGKQADGEQVVQVAKQVREHNTFADSLQEGSTKSVNVKKRINLAKAYFQGEEPEEDKNPEAEE
ncbi:MULTISPECIES: DUF262 domain-containing protein [unclassified Luteococcus]|uniref:DUF262 domain-containing protein n=1 Tax=unclassified Luteococcus TaxID=2639923 RepID=UPI00313C4AD4